MNDALGVFALFFRGRSNPFKESARVAFDCRQRRRDIVEHADEQLSAALLLLLLTRPRTFQIPAHRVECTTGHADLVVARLRERTVKIALLHSGGSRAYLGERREDLRGENMREIPAEQQDARGCHEKDEDEQSVQNEISFIVRKERFLRTPGHWYVARADDEHAAARILPAEEETVFVPYERRALPAVFFESRALQIAGICIRRQIEPFALLLDRDADARALEEMQITLNIMELNLLFFCLGMQRTQRELHGKRGTLLRPEERECLLLERTDITQAAEQHSPRGKHEDDGDDHHERVRDQQSLFERNIPQMHIRTPFWLNLCSYPVPL